MTSRVPATVASAVGGRSSIVIRYALPADGPALTRLEQLADRRLPRGPLLVAETDGELLAAASATGGGAVTNPFRVTLDVVELIELRARQLRAAA